MRGENVQLDKKTVASIGSPPLARGKRCRKTACTYRYGITPACAGKTRSCAHCIAAEEDHPRLRGENLSSVFLKKVIEGAPPLARGKPAPIRSMIGHERITPACAGKTSFSGMFQRRIRDHPRLRGENDIVLACPAYTPGSPPLARGKLLHPLAHAIDLRITPACAGKTWLMGATGTGKQDHPRLRGENVLSKVSCCSVIGSPPLARGKLYFFGIF